ncbi:MAG: preprotein translocase subunit SecG [Ureaplasma sp.]|nr:preprotein translocase subunit SecG [Ureaplasma sp.]MDE6289325.1 preprotein translocase subunit SecG [Ureaplasma sp.]
MIAVTIVCSILAVLCVIVGLILSRAGTSGGLTSIMGQDLEIFKKSKDRGIMKFFQILMFVMSIILLFIVLIVHILV